MKKFVCDRCNKIVEEKEVKILSIDYNKYDLCKKCYKETKGITEDIENLVKDYIRFEKEIYNIYNLKYRKV